MKKFPRSKEYEIFEAKVERISAMTDVFVKLFADATLTKLFDLIPRVFEQGGLKESVKRFNGKFNNFEELFSFASELSLVQVFCAFEVYLKDFFIARFSGNLEEMAGAVATVDITALLEAKNLPEAQLIAVESFFEEFVHQNVGDLIALGKKLIKKDGGAPGAGLDTEGVKKAQEVRNLLIHHGGIINARFVKRIGGSLKKLKPGEPYLIGMEEFYRYLAAIKGFAFHLDCQSPKVKHELQMQALQRRIDRGPSNAVAREIVQSMKPK